MNKILKQNVRAIQILKALLVSYIVTGILLLLLAAGMYKFELSESVVSIGIIVIYILACFLGGLITGKCVTSRKFIWGLGMGIVYFVILTGISFAVNRKLDGDLVNLLTTFLMCAGGGMLGGMLA